MRIIFEQQVTFTNFPTKFHREYFEAYKKAEKKLSKRYSTITMLTIILGGITLISYTAYLSSPTLAEYSPLLLFFLMIICVSLIVLFFYINHKEESIFYDAEKIATEEIGKNTDSSFCEYDITRAINQEEKIKEFITHRAYAEREYFIFQPKHYLSEYGDITCVIEYTDGTVKKAARIDLRARLEWNIQEGRPTYDVLKFKFSIPNTNNMR